MRYSLAPMLNLTKIKAITLDLDDTLWPIWPAIERAEAALSEWLAPILIVLVVIRAVAKRFTPISRSQEARS